MKDFSCTNKAGIRVENADQMLFFPFFLLLILKESTYESKGHFFEL